MYKENNDKMDAYISITATDPCIPDPCHNYGVCSQNGQGFICTCQGGFTGDMCGIARKSIIKLCVDLLTIESMDRDQDPSLKDCNSIQFNPCNGVYSHLPCGNNSNITIIVKKISKLLKSITISGFSMINLQGIDAVFIASVHYSNKSHYSCNSTCQKYLLTFRFAFWGR